MLRQRKNKVYPSKQSEKYPLLGITLSSTDSSKETKIIKHESYFDKIIRKSTEYITFYTSDGYEVPFPRLLIDQVANDENTWDNWEYCHLPPNCTLPLFEKFWVNVETKSWSKLSLRQLVMMNNISNYLEFENIEIETKNTIISRLDKKTLIPLAIHLQDTDYIKDEIMETIIEHLIEGTENRKKLYETYKFVNTILTLPKKYKNFLKHFYNIEDGIIKISKNSGCWLFQGIQNKIKKAKSNSIYSLAVLIIDEIKNIIFEMFKYITYQRFRDNNIDDQLHVKNSLFILKDFIHTNLFEQNNIKITLEKWIKTNYKDLSSAGLYTLANQFVTFDLDTILNLDICDGSVRLIVERLKDPNISEKDKKLIEKRLKNNYALDPVYKYFLSKPNDYLEFCLEHFPEKILKYLIQIYFYDNISQKNKQLIQEYVLIKYASKFSEEEKERILKNKK